MKRSQYATWVNILALLFLIEGLLLAAVSFLFSYSFSTLTAVGWGEWSFLSWGLFFIVSIITILLFLAAWGLWQKREWGRVVAAVAGIIGILGFPLGTAVGILSIWLLLMEKNAGKYFR